MQTGRKRIAQVVAAAVGLALVVVLSRHERAAFDLVPRVLDEGELLEDAPSPR